MKTIEITTAQKVTIQYELASVGNRIAAFFIDMMVGVGILIFINIIAIQTIGTDYEHYEYYFYLVVLPIILFYTLVSEILLDGQTIGKRITGLKVVKMNGDPASAFDYLIRWSFRFIDIWMSAGSVAALLISSSPYSQRLGCILSGTTVIRKTSSRIFVLKDILNIYTRDSYQPKYIKASTFNEKDMLFVKKVLDRNKKYKNAAHRELLEKLADKIAFLLGEPAPKEKEKFLNTVLADYIVLTR